jgi:hypothetical protein
LAWLSHVITVQQLYADSVNSLGRRWIIDTPIDSIDSIAERTAIRSEQVSRTANSGGDAATLQRRKRVVFRLGGSR